MQSFVKKTLPIFLTLLFAPYVLKAQTLERQKIINAYIYNFAKNVTWQNENQFSEFNFKIISSNQTIIEEFKKIGVGRELRGKKVRITAETNLSNSDNVHLIFVASDRHEAFKTIFNKIEGKNTLLISDNYLDKRIVMINFVETKDSKLHFEINKANIINQEITILPELVLLGGTEIDVAKMYRESQQSLRDVEKQINALQNQYDNLLVKIDKSNKQVAIQQDQIERQKIIQSEQQSKVGEHKAIITEQLLELENKQIALKQMKDSLKTNEITLQKQYQEIQNSKETLENKTNEIESINNKIIERNLILADKNKLIIEQRRNLYLLSIVSVIAFGLFLAFLNAYRQNRKKTSRLYLQRGEIRRINTQLFENNKELKKSLKEIKQMQHQLVQSEKMASLGVLSAGIAHEINNPINFVYAGINSLLKDFEDIEPVINEISKLNPDSDKLQEKLKRIEKLKKENYFDEAFEAIPQIISDIKIGADRTAEIIKGLSSFSRADKGKLKHLNIHDSIDTSLLLLKNKYKNRIEIIKNFGNEIPDLKCYPGKINQAFLNVLSNAIDAIDEKGKIWITTEKQNNNVLITIKDSGCGISKNVQKKLFDPFFTTKPVGQGTGLGLSITYGIIKEHKGTIEVKSDLDKGAEFIITLPLN